MVFEQSLLDIDIRDLVLLLSNKGQVNLVSLQLVIRLFHLEFPVICSFRNMSLFKFQNGNREAQVHIRAFVTLNALLIRNPDKSSPHILLIAFCKVSRQLFTTSDFTVNEFRAFIAARLSVAIATLTGGFFRFC